jgi:transcription antitermination factor NusG
LWRQLKDRGFEVFYPRLYLPTGNGGGLKIRSFFPGYLFVKVDFGSVSLSTFQWMPYTEGLVCIDEIPAYVPDRLIQAIQRHLERINAVSKKLSDVAQEDELGFDGFFAGENNIFDAHLTDGERVRALLRALNSMKASPELSSSQA